MIQNPKWCYKDFFEYFPENLLFFIILCLNAENKNNKCEIF
jgi:hypothetical protein